MEKEKVINSLQLFSGLSFTIIAILSRVPKINNEVAMLLGSHYNRSVFEHGLGAMGGILTLEIFLYYLFKDDDQEFPVNILTLVLSFFYLLTSIKWEVEQSINLNRDFQLAQLIADFSGIGLGCVISSSLKRLTNSSE